MYLPKFKQTTLSTLLVFAFLSLPSIAQDKKESRDGNDKAAVEKSRERKSDTSYSDRYRERYSSDSYRERNNSENYRDTMIEKGRQRRRERFSGDTRIHFDYLQQGANLKPPLEKHHDLNVHTDDSNPDNPVTYIDGRGVRIPIRNQQQERYVNPMRQQQLRTLLQPPSLLQRYTGQVYDPTQPLITVPQQFPQQNNFAGQGMMIPPINQPQQQQNLDLQPQPINIQQNQFQNQPAKVLPPPTQQNPHFQRHLPVNQNGVFLPFPLSRQQNVVPPNQQNTLRTRPFRSNQRNPALNSRYQSNIEKNEEQDKDVNDIEESNEKDSDD